MKVARKHEVTVAGLVSFTCSSGFHEMDETEMRATYGSTNSKRFAIKDNTRHIVVSVIWNEAGRFIGRFATARDTNHGLEKQMSKALRNSHYSFEGHYEREVAGQLATCFSYTYEVGGQPQMGDVVTIKCGRTFLSFCCVLDPKTEKRSRKLFDDILASVQEV